MRWGIIFLQLKRVFPDGRYADIPVVVLVNSNCMSAGDGMAKFLGDCPNVTLMGSLSLTRIIPGKISPHIETKLQSFN